MCGSSGLFVLQLFSLFSPLTRKYAQVTLWAKDAMIGAFTALASQFPPPESAREDGLLCLGGDLRPERLIAAYSHTLLQRSH